MSLLGQDVADLLIEDSESAYDYSHNDTYLWQYHEVIIKTPTFSKTYYKRGVTDYKKVIINGRDLVYDFDKYELAIDTLSKFHFNFTREIDLAKFDPYGYNVEPLYWYDVAQEIHIPDAKFQVMAKIIPYRYIILS